MPVHKGIKISIVSQCELKMHPEFPHPESSQFTNRSPRADVSRGSLTNFPDFDGLKAAESKADKLLGRQPAVSVYIPSLPGARFWIRYNVIEAAALHTPWYYFKMFMNGRNVVNWGTNAKTRPHGQVMKGLFDPSERWNYKQDGIVYKNNGTESRPFFFNVGSKEQTVAQDGGLIECRVYRARGRQRTMPKPDPFKPQEEYGIVMPSGGLIDKPQDAKFYDWHLKDPIDQPFATFKFHYRSWDNLAALHLIPADYPRQLLPPSPSILSLNGVTMEILEDRNGLVPADEVKKHDSARDSINSESSDNSPTPWSRNVFDGSPQSSEKQSEHHPLQTLVRVPISKFSQASAGRPLPDPIKQRWIGQMNRPLPEIPTRGASLQLSRSPSPGDVPHSRNPSACSALSGAPSVTPSLLPYLERDVHSPEPEIGVAAIMPMPRSASKDIGRSFVNGDELEFVDQDSEANIPSSGNEKDIQSPSELDLPSATSLKKRRGMASPPLGRLFSLSKITMRKKKKSPLHSSPAATSSIDIVNMENSAEEKSDSDPGNMTTLSITESEWMCRTPSPILDEPRSRKLWSPVPGQVSKNGHGVRIKSGNWI